MSILQKAPSTPAMSTPSNSPQTPPISSDAAIARAQRSRKQLTVFFAGASFLALSALITRRALARRRLAIMPSFYEPSNAPPRLRINGAMEAFEALNIATINVTSFAIMTTGGLMWAFDVGGIDDMRRKIRGGLGIDGSGRSEKEVEEEFEEWLATVLERKKQKEEERLQEGRQDVQVTNERGRPR